ncbi:MAG TPA: hypothetical protein VF113_12160 [Stellaceae bacterium]
MDEESIGLLGVLLIVTGLVVSHQVQTSRAVPMLHDVHWPQLVDVLGCNDPSDRNCTAALAR